MNQGSTPSAVASAREEAGAALKERPWDSAVSAFKFAGALLPLCAMVTAGLVALGKFNVPLLIGLIIGLVSSWPAALVAFELKRLSRCRRALKEIIRSEKSYEDLLRDTRQERDQAVNDRIAAETRASMHAEAFRLVALIKEQLPKGHHPEEPEQPQQLSSKTKRRP